MPPVATPPVATLPVITPSAETPPAPATGRRAELAALIAEARKAGFRPRAEELFKQAIEANPDSAEAHSGLALLYLNQGRNVQAKQSAEQALELDEQSDEAWIVLGAAEGAVGRLKAARRAYKRCAALPSGKHVAECKRLVR
jgi:Tfp pilus assembly protein PilF